MLKMAKPALLLLLTLLSLLPQTQSCLTTQFSANGVCNPCSVTCSTCTSSATTSCLSCPTTRFLNAFGACQCNAGFVEQATIVAACVAITCSNTCLTCNNTATTCTTCNSANNRVYISGNSTCTCAAKYYEAGVAVCAGCHYSCTTCSTSGLTNCLTCDNATAFRSYSAGKCLCLSGYYDSSVYICSACNYKCLTCVTSATNCQTCGANRGVAPGCLASQGYYDDGTSNACPACNYTCKNCSDGVSCNVCNAAAFRILSSLTPLCACMSRYYDAGTFTTTCSSCDPRCFTCSSTSVCLSCNSTAYRAYDSSSKFCLCMTGYYQTSTTLQLCSACNSRCLTCVGTSTNCTTCDSSMNRALSSNACPCKTGFYETALIQCFACHSSCYSCSNSTACTGCAASTLMSLNSSSLCSCVTTMYYNTTLNICQSCNYQCATCNSSSPTICLSCPTGSSRTLANSACPCNIYYYDAAVATCTRCHYSCRTCTGATAATCNNCTTAAYRYMSSTSCLCQTLYYDNGNLELCQPCNYMCLSCLDAVNCTSCNSTLYRSLVTSSCACVTYYFEYNRSCSSCNYSCYSCNTFATCLTCNATSDFRVFNATTQMCDCLAGYYDNFVDRTCSACLPECYICTNATTCTACDSTRHRAITATYRCPCIALYFDLTGTCTGCKYFCATCTAPTTCATCNSTAMRLLSSSSLCVCANNYYDDGSNELCLPCSYGCLTCVNSSQQCTSCDTTLRSMVSSWCTCAQHYYDNNVTIACVKCQYSCSACLRANNCSTCNTTLQRQFDSINQYCICAIGYFDNSMDQACQTCNYRCLTCTNSSQCLTCSGAWFRATPTAMCPCLDGYYDDGSSATCKKCHYSCATCTDGSHCLTCDLTTYHRTFDASYLCSCINRYFDDTFGNQLCQPCVYSCLTCSIITSNCTSCNSTAYRLLQSSACACQQHFYDNLAELCLACDYTCSTCVMAAKCSSCNATIQRIADSSTGKCKCSNMFWDDGLNEVCQACEPTCFTCLNMDNCTSCNSTRNRLLNSTTDFFKTSSPYCVCLYRYYSPTPTQDCLPCHYSCQVCTAGTRNDCVLCTTEAKRMLNGSAKACLCLNGYYDNNSSQICQLCNAACTTCTTGLPNSCTACSSLYYHLVETTSCFTACPSFYYSLQTNWTCQACSTYCKTCVNSTYCSVCDSAYLLYQQQCISACPAGTYSNVALGVCLDCPRGCFNCSGNSRCFACFQGYYYNQTLGFCFSCNSVCLNCTGPGQKDCTACASTLFLQKGSCSVISCSMGTYIDPIKGCLPCSDLFPGSLLCNITQPFSCSSNYIFSSNSCLYCDLVPGYKYVNGKCGQICGDGILIYLQCDDGNLVNGDGCSSKCTIEAGWNCSNAGKGSRCQLISAPTITLESVSKSVGFNKVVIRLSISIPIIITTSDLQLIISNFSKALYSYSIKQIAANLSSLEIYLNYSSPIQGKNMQLSYGSSRRLSEARGDRQLATLTFDSTFSIDTYPPALYYPDTTLTSFTQLQSYITALSIALLVLSFIIVPKRMHLHTLSFVYIPAQIYVAYCLTASKLTDWIQYTLQFMNRAGMFGGFGMGRCCQSTYSAYGLTSEIMQVCGIALFVIIGTWLLLVFLQLFSSYCLSIEQKLKNIRYFIFTVNLAVSFILIYSATNALYNYTLLTRTDVFNTVLAILLSIFFFVGLIFVWVRTYELKIVNKPRAGKVFSLDKSNDIVVNLPPVSQKISEKEPDKEIISASDRDEEQTNQLGITRSSKFTEILNKTGNDYEPLLFDYSHLYSQPAQKEGEVLPAKQTKAKYYLPMLMTKIYLSALLASLMQSVPFYFFIVLASLQLIFLFFLLIVAPFQSTFTNFRLVIMSLMSVTTHTTMCVYLFQANSSSYNMSLQQLVVYMLMGVLAAAAFFVFLEHLLAWKREIWRKVFEPCLKGSRFMGTKRVPTFEVQSSDQMDKSSMKMSKNSFKGYAKDDENEEMQAFYARMLKKEQLNKKYKRERMIR